MTIGLVIKGTFRASMIGDENPLLCSAHDYTFLPKPKGSAFGEIVSEAVFVRKRYSYHPTLKKVDTRLL